MSRMTPPLRRMSWPAVRTILGVGGGGLSALSASRVVGGVFEREGEVRGKGGIYSLTSARLPGRAWWGKELAVVWRERGRREGMRRTMPIISYSILVGRLSPGCCVSIAGED